MPKPTVYLDSTIPSAYFDDRPEMVLRRRTTRVWWARAPTEYLLTASTVLRDEVGRGSRRDRAEARLRLICAIPLIDVSPEIRELADWYVLHKLMPERPDADAVHLATATIQKCAYLATWNFGHLVNQNKAVHLDGAEPQTGTFSPPDLHTGRSPGGVMMDTAVDGHDYILGESPEEIRQSRLAQLERLLKFARRLIAAGAPDRDTLQAWIELTLADMEKIRAGIHVPDLLLEEKRRVQLEIRAEFPTTEAWCRHANESARKAGFRIVDSLPPRHDRVPRERFRDEEAAD
jgi:hypothetical protein